MKLSKYIVFLLLLIIPLKVEAKISMSCPGSTTPNREIKCTVTSDYKITSFESTLVLDDKAIFFGASPGTDFQNKNTIGKSLSYTSTSGGTNVASINIFIPATITSNTTITVSLTEIKYIFSSDVDVKTQDAISEKVAVTVQTTTTTTTTTKTTTTTQPGTEKTFTVTLDTNNGTNKTSSESCSTKGNSCKIDLSKVTTPAKTGAAFNGWGNKATCTEGNKNSYTADSNITLYACWGTSSTTTTTTQAGSTTTSSTTTNGTGNTTNIYLKSLSIEGQTLEFSKFITDYELKVLYEVESLTITADPATEGVNVEIGDASALQVGENTIIIKLTDEAGNTNSYVVKVNRLNEGEEIRESSSDATLKSVAFGNYSVNFSPTVNNYELIIDSGNDTLPVTAVTTDENAIYVVEGNFDLQTGSIIKIIVKAEDGVTLNTYNFTITVKGGIMDYILYIAIGGVLLIALIALVIYQSKSKKPPKKAVPKTPVKAPVKPTTAAPKTAPKPPTKPVTTKNEVEVLDI